MARPAGRNQVPAASLAAALLFAAACGSAVPAVATPPAEPSTPDAGPAATGDAASAAPETPMPPADARDAQREAPEPEPSAPGPAEGGRGGGGRAETCFLLPGTVLPRCSPTMFGDGCPLDVPATAGVAIEIVRSTGYEQDIAADAFDEVAAQLLSCYGESLAETPEAASTVEVTLDVPPSGCATVRRTSGDWPTRAMRDCTCGVLVWWAMPVPDAEGGGTLELRIVFTP